MVNTSKILTVSYGTFSCTLEGFDDSFGTIKAVAEYFRGLAADDRYFGAEPPVPDAEMLARIAENEISRRVEARQEHGRFLLCADPDAAKSPPVAPDAERPYSAPDSEIANAARGAPNASNSEQEQDGNDEISPDHSADNVTAEATAVEKITTEPAPAPPKPDPARAFGTDSAAARLQRIRAVVAKADKDTVTQNHWDEEQADNFLTHTPTKRELPAEEPDKPRADEAADRADGKDENTNLPPAEAIDHTEFPDVPAFKDASAEQEETPTEHEHDDPRNETATGEDATSDRPEAINLFSPERLVSFDFGPTSACTSAPTSITPPTPIRARIVKMKRSEFETAVIRDQLEEDNGDDVGDTPKPATSSRSDVPDGRGLSPADEAELQRELAAIESELALEDDDEPNEEQTATVKDNNKEPDKIGDIRDRQEALAPEEETVADSHDEPPQPQDKADRESDFSRILDKTNHAMAESERHSRRSAIEHLRAAVAATRAEKNVGSDLRPPEDNSEAYREDLAEVMRPRRPQIDAQRTRADRPAESRPAPLKLVAEQRIDARSSQTSAVCPRRISLREPAEPSKKDPQETEPPPANPGNFAKFAEAAGAIQLPDLLEAAAAYMAFVEGRPQFSRPQLINKIRQLEQREFSGKKSRRSFGQLVQQGTLQKLGEGQFTISDQTSFRPSKRQAG